MFPLLLSALSLGLLSSFHCAGMCGPLLMALPVQHLSSSGRVLAQVSYHAARLATYMLLGLLFGVLGHSLYLAGWQQQLSIIAGIFVLIFTLLRSTKILILPGPLNRVIYRLWTIKMPGKFFFMGMANGLLPCGMVYFALAAALSTGDTGRAVGFMLCFGLGTLPLLAALTWYGHRLSVSLRVKMRKAIPYFLATMGVLLILRGLNLGIPFISPVLPDHPSAAIDCHRTAVIEGSHRRHTPGAAGTSTVIVVPSFSRLSSFTFPPRS